MADVGHHTTSKFFGITQGLIFVLVVVTAILFRRRQRLMEKDVGATFAAADLRSAIRRTPIASVPPSQSPPSSAPDAKAAPREQLKSAFPSWTEKTPAHEVLGVAPTASDAEIEAAYKSLLKSYHPDRFASWGAGYQNRAHRIVLLLQDAREKMRATTRPRS